MKSAHALAMAANYSNSNADAITTTAASGLAAIAYTAPGRLAL